MKPTPASEAKKHQSPLWLLNLLYFSAEGTLHRRIKLKQNKYMNIHVKLSFLMSNYTQCTISCSLGGLTKMIHSQLKMHQMAPCKLIQSDQNTEGDLTEQFLLLFLYNHRKIKTSNFFVSFEVTKCGHCLCQFMFLKHLCSYHKSLSTSTQK